MNGVECIAAERQRQIEEEGWTAEHDEQHDRGELAAVAALYAIEATGLLDKQAGSAVFAWLYPSWWAEHWWRPRKLAWELEDTESVDEYNAMRCLEKAGALIAAEIDRRLRVSGEEDGE